MSTNWSLATYESRSLARTSWLSCRLPNSTDLMCTKLSSYLSPVNQTCSSPSLLYLRKCQFHFPPQCLIPRILESTLTLSFLTSHSQSTSKVYQLCLRFMFIKGLFKKYIYYWHSGLSHHHPSPVLLKYLLTASVLTPSIFNTIARVILVKYNLNQVISLHKLSNGFSSHSE